VIAVVMWLALAVFPTSAPDALVALIASQAFIKLIDGRDKRSTCRSYDHP